jgi:hypothetical protein
VCRLWFVSGVSPLAVSFCRALDREFKRAMETLKSTDEQLQVTAADLAAAKRRVEELESDFSETSSALTKARMMAVDASTEAAAARKDAEAAKNQVQKLQVALKQEKAAASEMIANQRCVRPSPSFCLSLCLSLCPSLRLSPSLHVCVSVFRSRSLPIIVSPFPLRPRSSPSLPRPRCIVCSLQCRARRLGGARCDKGCQGGAGSCAC